MSVGELVLPVAVAMSFGMAAAALHRRVSPSVAARALVSTIVALGVAVGVTAVSWSAAFLAHRPRLLDLAGWCHHMIGSHDTVPGWLGAAATVLIVVGAIRCARVLRAWRSFRRTDRSPVEVVCSERLFACTLPGPGQQIVVSSALLSSLEPSQVEVVLAHERAHGRHRHDRYLLAGNLAVALVPWLIPLRRRLEFTLERWADEAAVADTGGDRHLLARTIARVALSQPTMPAGAPAFAGLGVAGRVDALSRPPVSGRGSARLAAMMLASGLATALVAVQLHHTGAWLLALCWS